MGGDERGEQVSAAAAHVSVRSAFATSALRRCQLAAGTTRIVEGAALVAVSVHLFGRGGAAVLAVYGVVRMVVPAVLTPAVAALLSRLQPGRAVALGLAIGAAATTGTLTLIATTAPVATILATDAVAAVAIGVVRPLVTSLLPSYIRSPQALVATNAASAMVETISHAAGPLVAGAAIAAGGTVPVLGAAVVLLGAVATVELGLPDAPDADHHRRGVLGDVADGARAIVALPTARLVQLLVSSQAFLRGALNVVVVGLAIDRLGLGEGGVGLLLGAVGVGGLLGLPLAMRLSRPGRNARTLGAGVLVWGLPFAVMAVTTVDPLVVALFAVIGVGNTLVDISADTLLQRIVPAGRLPRALGFFEAAVFASAAAGSAVAGLLLDVLDLPDTLVVLGLLLPLVAGGAWMALRRLDAAMRGRDASIAVLQLNAILSPLVLSTVDQLATRTRADEHGPGDRIIAEGDVGDRFYVIEQGEAEVRRGGELVAVLTQGECFGEMALLDDAPRNATVVARTQLTTRSLGREDFLATIATDERARGAAVGLARQRRTD